MCAYTAPALAANAQPTADAALKLQSKAANTTPAAKLDKLVQGFLVKSTRYYDDMGFSSNHYDYTPNDLRMLAIVITLEAGSEPYKTKLAVGNVVMNRVLSPGYPGDTIHAVLTQPNQFSYNPSVKPNAQSTKAALDVLKYETWVVPQNTYFFRATASKSDWGGHTFSAILGRTAFYTASYAGRSNAKGIPDKLHERVYQWPQYGSKHGADVRDIQVMLKSLGYKGSTDGYFGQDTRAALMKFQTSRGIRADGIAGPATLRAMVSKYGISKFMHKFAK